MIFKKYNKEGFTLVEMMVVIGIFLIVTGVILINVPNFREKTSVDLVAQDLAVTIRSSQVFGIGTKAIGDSSVAYGVYLSTEASKKGQFVLFADLPDSDGKTDLIYNPSTDGTTCGQTSTECQSLYSLNGFNIVGINIYSNDSPNPIPLSDINISFLRPKSNPRFCTSSGNPCPEDGISKAEIIVESLKEKKQKEVVVYANGQIAVQDVIPA